MLNITNNEILTKRYDMLQLMIAQNTLNEIESQLEPLIQKWVNNYNDTKRIYVNVWVNELLFDIWLTMKHLEPQVFKTAFKYNMAFERNGKMSDGEYKIYKINIHIEDKYENRRDVNE